MGGSSDTVSRFLMGDFFFFTSLGWCIGGGFQKGEKPGFLLPGGQDAGERGVDQGRDPPQASLDTGVQQEPGEGEGCPLPPSKPPEPLASTPAALRI